MASNGADIILNDPRFANKPKLNALTICKTEKLATPGPGTALAIIREIRNRGRLETLYIAETRPYNQGARLTTIEALYDNLPGVLITDSMVGWLMANKKVDYVVTGADRVTNNGTTANKIGTYTLSVLANYHNIPFFVACHYSTIDEKISSASDIIVEERPGDEIKTIGDVYIAPKDIKI